MKKKIIAMFTAAALCVGMLPASAMADEEKPAEEVLTVEAVVEAVDESEDSEEDLTVSVNEDVQSEMTGGYEDPVIEEEPTDADAGLEAEDGIAEQETEEADIAEQETEEADIAEQETEEDDVSEEDVEEDYGIKMLDAGGAFPVDAIDSFSVTWTDEVGETVYSWIRDNYVTSYSNSDQSTVDELSSGDYKVEISFADQAESENFTTGVTYTYQLDWPDNDDTKVTFNGETGGDVSRDDGTIFSWVISETGLLSVVFTSIPEQMSGYIMLDVSLLDGEGVAKIGGDIYTTLQDAVDNAADGDTIEIIDDIELEETVTISGKSITITTDGGTGSTLEGYGGGYVVYTDSNSIGDYFSIIDGSSVTFNGASAESVLMFDDYYYNYGIDSYYMFLGNAFASVINGTLILGENTFVEEFYGNQSDYSGATYIIGAFGEGSEFILNGGDVSYNYLYIDTSSYDKVVESGVISAYDGAELIIEAGTICGNYERPSTTNYGIGNYDYVASTVYVEDASLIMSGGEISSNNSYFGAVSVQLGTFTLTGGEISNNTGGYGGGIFLNFAEFEMTNGKVFNNFANATGNTSTGSGIGGGICVYFSDAVISGGEITNNGSSWYGGGLYVGSGYPGFSASCSVSGETSITGNSSYYGGGLYVFDADFEMTSGTISGNEATMNGGGIWYGSDGIYPGTVSLSGGAMAGNSAGLYGGAIYEDNDATGLYLYNVQITGNTATQAASSVIGSPYTGSYDYIGGKGGGIWICPDGHVDIYMTNGGIVTNNTAQNAGDDISFNPAQGGATLYMSDRVLGGGKVTYYEDGANGGDTGGMLWDDSVQRYSNGNANVVDAGSYTTDVSAHSVVSDSVYNTAVERAELVITGNSATVGGAIAANSTMQIGTEDEYTYSVDIFKYVENEDEKTGIAGAEFIFQDENNQYAVFTDDDDKYVFNEWTDSEEDATTLTSDEDGYIHLTGLEAGTYKLTEDKAPYGYITLEEPVEVVVSGDDFETPIVVEVENKEPEPQITKEIAEDDYERKDEDIEHDDANGHFEENVDGDGWGTWDDADNNQDVTYRLKLTDIKDAVNLTVHDYLEDGLDFEQDSLSIVLFDNDEDDEGTILNADTDYTLSQPDKCSDPGCEMDGCTFEVKFEDSVFEGISSEAHIVITYEALTDTHEEDYDDYEDEILNQSYMTYGINTYRSAIVTTATDLFGFGVYKYAGEDDEEIALAGAEFVLERGGVYATFDTETDPDTGEVYYMITGWVEDKDSAGTLTSDADGMIRIEGLDDDTYTITETKAPVGYEIVDEVITVIIDEDGTVTVNGDTGSKEAVIGHVVNVENTEILTEVSGTKTWIDNDDQDGYRPESITIYLLADGTVVDSVVVTEAGEWSYSFTDLPMYKDGNEIAYTILEEAIDHYGPEYSGYDIENDHTPDQTSVSVTKAWDDADDQDGIRPENITVQLYADGDPVDGATLTLDESNNWTGSFTGLDIFHDHGERIEYTIQEVDVPDGYECTIEAVEGSNYVYAVTNKHTPETIDISGTKTWDDNDNEDGLRPESITIHLLADGTEVDKITVTEADGWKWSFTNLPKYKEGTEIVYTITEDDVDKYETVIDGYDVTNTHEHETVDLSGAKIWNDDDNQDGYRPESITIYLLADGEVVDSVTVTEEDGWSWSFTDKPMYKDGVEIVYIILEDAVDNYSTEYDGYDVINNHTPDQTSVSVTKAWEDADDQDGIRPESVTVQLYADGESVEDATLTLDESNNWTGSFTELDIFKDQGERIAYTIEETDVPDGYECTIEAAGDSGYVYVATNTHTPEATEVSGSKTWDDSGNQDGKRPSSITIRLLADGEEVDSVTLTEADKWEWNFTGLPKYSAGTEISYTVVEDAVDDYSTTYDGYNITNSYTPGQTSLTVVKAWDDDNNADGIRAASVTVELLKNGVNTGQTIVLTADNNWTGSFTELDEYTDGKLNAYAVQEVDVEGYTGTISGDETSGYVITNTHTPEKVDNPNPGTPNTGNPDNGNPNTGNPDNGNPNTGNPTTGGKTGDVDMTNFWILLMIAAAAVVVAGVTLKTRPRINK